MLRRLVRDSAIYASSSVLARAIGLALLPFYTRALVPADFGVIDILGVVGGFLNLVLLIELPQALARFYPAASAPDRREYASTTLLFALFSFSGFSLVALAAADFLAELILETDRYNSAFRVAILALWSGGLFYVLQNQLRWRLQPVAYAMTNTIAALVSSIVAVVLVVIFDFGVTGMFWGMFAGMGLGSLIALYVAREDYGPTFSSSKFLEMVQFSAPLMISSLAVLVSTFIDRIAVKQILGIDELGLYGIGQRFAAVASLLLLGIQGTLIPMISRNQNDPQTPAQIARLLKYFVAIALPINLGLCIYARELLILFTTPNFYSASAVIPFLAAASIVSGLYVFAPGLWLARRTRTMMYASLASAGINVGLNFALVPFLGIMGAAVATLLGAIASFLFVFLLGRKHYPVPFDWTAILRGCGVFIGVTMLGVLVDGPALQTAVIKLAILALGGGAIFVATMGLGESSKLTRRFLHGPR